MTRYLARACAVAALFALAGCGRQTISDTPEDTQTRLSEECSIDVADWLSKPRADLAKLADQHETELDTQQKDARNQGNDDMLLPTLVAPRRVAVFRKAKYDASLGVSLPDYAKPGKPDDALALHLARFGDHEAALKFADGTDGKKAVDALKGEKNYPLEWSRLVSMALLTAQHKLANGDPEGAAEIVGIHKQLAKLLDAKTAAGPLGAALLPAGRRAIVQAGKAFRGPKWNKTALAGDLEEAAAAWGTAPAIPTALGMTKTQAEKIFGAEARGRSVVSKDLDRARDLLALPLPTEAAQAVVAFFDDKGNVGEIAVAYRGKLETTYPDADHLAYHLDEAGVAAKDEPKSPGVSKSIYSAKDRYEIARSNRSAGFGALVRINAGTAPPDGGLRDLGPVSFARGFEANRLAWVPSRPGPLVTVEDKDALKSLISSTSLPSPLVAVLQRDAAADIVHALRLTWSPEINAEVAAKLFGALSAFGPASIDGVEQAGHSSLRLSWQDASTKAELRLPYDEKPPIFSIEDVQDGAAKAERVKLVSARDAKDRGERIAASKPRDTLTRSPGLVNDFSLEKLTLGQSRAEATAALPTGNAFRTRAVPGGLSVLVTSSPEEPVAYWASQVLVRFDASDTVSEIRVRYAEGAAGKGESLLEQLSAGKAGQPESQPATWEALWSDQKSRSPKPTAYRWQDDRTTRTYQRDAGGSEVTWRDRDAELTPWRFVSQGPKGFALGEDKAKIDQTHKAHGTSGGATVYSAPSKGPYESILVWYTLGKAERIVAVARAKPGVLADEVTAALHKSWGVDVFDLGAIRRKDGRRGSVLGAYFWHDDQTRVQTFAQMDDQGARVLTEWRMWPIASAKATAKR